MPDEDYKPHRWRLLFSHLCWQSPSWAPEGCRHTSQVVMAGEATSCLTTLASLAQHHLCWLLQSETPGLFGQNRPGWPVWWEYESSHLLWFIVSDKECGALTGQWTMGTRDKLGLARLALEEAPCMQPSCARVGAETCPPAEATWTRSFGQWQGTQLHWAAHLPRSRHQLELGPWGVMKDCQTSPIQTRKLVSSSCCIFTKCVNVCTDKVRHNADQVW